MKDMSLSLAALSFMLAVIGLIALVSGDHTGFVIAMGLLFIGHAISELKLTVNVNAGSGAHIHMGDDYKKVEEEVS